MTQQEWIEHMKWLWNVDVTDIPFTEELAKSYYKQENLTRELIRKGKIVDKNKDCTFMRAWGRKEQLKYESKK